MHILFVNCCISQSGGSRTKMLCDAFICAYQKEHPEDMVDELTLENEELSWMTAETLNQRDALIADKQYTAPIFRYAWQLAQADKIIVGAPYWDLSFPALLKVYIENVSVNGIAFHYTEQGPEGLCRAKKLLYLTTAGGFLNGADSGIAYMNDVCNMFGIGAFDSIAAEGLDIDGADIGGIMEQACKEAAALAVYW